MQYSSVHGHGREWDERVLMAGSSAHRYYAAFVCQHSSDLPLLLYCITDAVDAMLTVRGSSIVAAFCPLPLFVAHVHLQCGWIVIHTLRITNARRTFIHRMHNMSPRWQQTKNQTQIVGKQMNDESKQFARFSHWLVSALSATLCVLVQHGCIRRCRSFQPHENYDYTQPCA